MCDYLLYLILLSMSNHFRDMKIKLKLKLKLKALIIHVLERAGKHQLELERDFMMIKV